MSFIPKRALSVALLPLAANVGFAQEAPRTPGTIDEEGAPVQVWLSRYQTDNLRRVVNGGRGAYTAPGVSFALAREVNRFDGGLGGAMEFRSYSADERVSDERVGDLNAFANVDIVPDRFQWRFNERYSTARTNFFRVDSVDNRENVSVFTTGPNVDLPLGERQTFSMSADFTDASYENTGSLDNQSLRYQLALSRRASTTSSYGLVATSRESEYGVDAFSYEIRSAALRYQKQLATGNMLVEAGKNELMVGDAESSGPLFRFTWSRDVGARSALGVSASREFTDASTHYGGQRGVIDVRGLIDTDLALSRSALNREQVSATYDWESRRTSFSLGAIVASEEFEEDRVFDNETISATLAGSRQLTSRSQLRVSYTQLKREFTRALVEDRDWSARVSYSREFGTQLALSGSVGKFERELSGEFDETFYLVRLTYSFRRE